METLGMLIFYGLQIGAVLFVLRLMMQGSNRL